MVIDKIKNYTDAKQFCSDKGADLVKINSAQENNYVLKLVRTEAAALQQVWIGLEWHGEAFYWSDLSVPDYLNWAEGEPNKENEKCGHMYVGGYPDYLPNRASGKWNDMVCQGLDGFPNGLVCKRLP